jgi:hypothetical protein
VSLKDSLELPATEPAKPLTAPTLGKGGWPECEGCDSKLDPNGNCPTCDAPDDEMEIDL